MTITQYTDHSIPRRAGRPLSHGRGRPISVENLKVRGIVPGGMYDGGRSSRIRAQYEWNFRLRYHSMQVVGPHTQSTEMTFQERHIT